MKKSILIIEDEIALLEMYSHKFIKAGFEVLTAEDGKIGQKLALERKPNVILIDLFIPVVDGMTVLTNLKSRLPDTKMIIATNLDQPEKEVEAKAKGADGYILKAKYLPSELVDEIEAKYL